MWANSLSRKYPLTARPSNTPACKAKDAVAAKQSVAIPASWDLSDKQRSFIESFMEPEQK